MEIRLMDGCCGRPRTTVFGCFDRGLTTRRAPPLPIRGPLVEDSSGLWAVFSIDVNGDRLEDLRFEAASCTTLIASCQALVETLAGRSLGDCIVDAQTITNMLPGIPPLHRDRAVLAAAALRAALGCAIQVKASSATQAQGRPT